MTEPLRAGALAAAPRWRRWLPFALAVGLLLALAPVARRWPSVHAIEIALEPPAGIEEVSLEVRPPGDEPIFRTTWTFAGDAAPPRLRAEVRAPSGEYEAEVSVARSGGARSSRAHALSLDGERRATLYVR